jgi:hypothetical protein
MVSDANGNAALPVTQTVTVTTTFRPEFHYGRGWPGYLAATANPDGQSRTATRSRMELGRRHQQRGHH